MNIIYENEENDLNDSNSEKEYKIKEENNKEEINNDKKNREVGIGDNIIKKKKRETDEERKKRIAELKEKIKQEEIEEEIKREKERIKENEEMQKRNYEKDLERIKKITKTFKLTCIEIENSLNSIYYSKRKKLKEKKENEVTNNKENNIQKIINKYKNMSKEARKELDIAMKINNINEIESSLIYKEKIYDNLKSENISLMKVKDSNLEIINKYNNEVNEREELINLNHKISIIKEEIKIKKEFLKVHQVKIKNQKKLIEKIEKKCKLINENIGYKKKQEIQNLENDKKKDDEELNYNILSIDYKNKKNKFLENEKKLKNSIAEQNQLMLKLKSELDLLYDQIGQTQKNIKISEKKIEENSIKKKEALKTFFSYENVFENSNKKDLFKTNNKIRNYNSLEKNYYPFNHKNKFETPFIIKPILNKHKISIQNENKLLKENMYREIEALKFSIQNTLNKENLSDKYTQIFYQNKNNNIPLNKRYIE